MATPVNVLLCCAPEDERLREDLSKHLSLLVRNELITLIHQQPLDAGLDEATQQLNRANAADVILLLLSNYLIATLDQKVETARALERHRLGQVRLIPVILYKVPWREDRQLGGLVPLPRSGRPVGQGSRADRDEALVEVVEGVKEVAGQVLRQRPAAPAKPREVPAALAAPPQPADPSAGVKAQQSAAVAPNPRPAGQVPTRRTLRQFLDQVLYSDERLDAFCSDEYPEIKRQFSQAMARDAKLTRILEYASLIEIVSRIEEWDGKRAQQYWGLLKFEA